MKRGLKLKAGTAHIKKMAEIPLDISIKRVMEELLPMLLGMQLLYGESPSQYLNSLRLPYARKLIYVLQKKGYIVGDDINWRFSESVLTKVVNNLETALGKRLGFAQNWPSSTSEPPVSLAGLRKHYASLLNDLDEIYWPRHGVTVLPYLRRLCKKFDSRFISQHLDEFFRYAIAYRDYSMDALEKYLTYVTQTKKGQSPP